MSNLDDALAAVKHAKHNAMNLADPDAALADAEMVFKEAVVGAINALTQPPPAPVAKIEADQVAEVVEVGPVPEQAPAIDPLVAALGQPGV